MFIAIVPAFNEAKHIFNVVTRLHPHVDRVIVVDDCSTDNTAFLAKEAGAVVKGMVAIFSYGFDVAAENFKEKNVSLTTLSNYDNLLEQALDSNYISEKELFTLREWRANPSKWNQ